MTRVPEPNPVFIWTPARLRHQFPAWECTFDHRTWMWTAWKHDDDDARHVVVGKLPPDLAVALQRIEADEALARIEAEEALVRWVSGNSGWDFSAARDTP